MVNCSSPELSGILYIVKNILLIIDIIAPILLMICLILEFIKMIKDPDDKKKIKSLHNKVMALFVIFMIPVVINAFMYILGEKTDFSSCWNNSSAPNHDVVYQGDDSTNKNSILINSNDYQPGEEKKNTNSGGSTSSSNTSFDLDHAINVGDYIHAKENENLQWNGKSLGPTGGAMGAYTEAVNILNGTDYRIYEVYNTVVSYHPEVKTKATKDPHQMKDVNDHYGLKVTFISRDVSSIKKALNEGKLVQTITDTNLFRNSENKVVSWSGRHWGLIFYYDGTYFHMKNAGSIKQKNAIYTDEQLAAWLNSSNIHVRPIVYEKK